MCFQSRRDMSSMFPLPLSFLSRDSNQKLSISFPSSYKSLNLAGKIWFRFGLFMLMAKQVVNFESSFRFLMRSERNHGSLFTFILCKVCLWHQILLFWWNGLYRTHQFIDEISCGILCVLNSGLRGRACQGTSLVITCSKSYFKMSMVDPCPTLGVLICNRAWYDRCYD
jgi:hypothetical protein